MSINAAQFQPGVSMAEFIERYGAQGKCYRALSRWRWPHGFRCPAWQGRRCLRFGRARVRCYACQACHHQTSLTAGTLLENTKLPLRTRIAEQAAVGDRRADRRA
ncbi:hypothetical protein XthCFBP4691_19835 [Xanthomonas theicola]|uniref:Transposase zinc-ribbon domain-containing protein n=1 Tax=Xanthomonas theicola TaxID=56464 RepID=A0A2S6Z277_9XANT|nr:hypothetical protein XthCFBP4691_19835 [Xanthomonas theicola]